MHSIYKKINGKGYNLVTGVSEQGKTFFTLNGVTSDALYHNAKHRVWFSPANVDGQDFWMISYNGKAYLTQGTTEMTEEAFLKEVASSAFPAPIGFLWVIVLLFAPAVLLYFSSKIFFENDSTKAYFFLATVGCIWFFLFHYAPIAHRNKRRKICLISLVATAINLAIFALQYVFAYL